MADRLINTVLKDLGGKFSSSLGINLETGESEEIFKWFLASILFGARISEKIAVNTYEEFKRSGILSPESITETGWDGLVGILDSGGYVRYDFKTANKLLEVCGNLIGDYEGDLNILHQKAKDRTDLEKSIKSLGKGIGEVTTNIFLRELRVVWEKAEPLPGSLAVDSAAHLGFIESRSPQVALAELRNVWKENKIRGASFADFEAALVRLGKDYCRKRRCPVCPVKEFCIEKA